MSLVQKCLTYNKPIFKGTIELRQDVKSLMETRAGYRRYKRSHKRYRKSRFLNRKASTRKGRVAPSILQKRQSTIRVINRLLKLVNIQQYYLEDVAIDIRAMTDGSRLYRWQYQKSNRVDENIRKAIILRDKCKCMECGLTDCVLEVHHIVPRRLKGSTTQGNLVTLCSKCHKKTQGKEETFISHYQSMIGGTNVRLDYAQHVMQGKAWLRSKLSDLGTLCITSGGDTANKRIDWNIEKSHSNDAIVITDLEVSNSLCDIKDWIIKPMRRQSKAKNTNDIYKHRDFVRYTKLNGESYTGYITAIKHNGNVNFTAKDGKTFRNYGTKSLSLVWRFNKIYWL
ncbi:MAG: RNA-guided endonuclease IscB [Sarcina sp.]